MNKYTLWQSPEHHNKMISHCNGNLPAWAEKDVITAESSYNPFYGYEVNFWLYTDKTMNKSKLYRAFMRLKKALPADKPATIHFHLSELKDL